MSLNMKLDNRQTDEEILSQYTPEAMKKAVEAKLNAEKTSDSPYVRRFRVMQGVMAAAAVLAVMVVVPVALNATKKSSEETVRVKGTSDEKLSADQQYNAGFQSTGIHLYKEDNGVPFLLQDGDKVKAGDLIQVTYTSENSCQAMIVSIDGNGNVTKHFPENTADDDSTSIKASTTQIPVKYAYELDDAKAYERFLFITSKKHFDLQNFRNTVSTLDTESALNKDFSECFPKDCNIQSFTLLK